MPEVPLSIINRSGDAQQTAFMERHERPVALPAQSQESGTESAAWKNDSALRRATVQVA